MYPNRALSLILFRINRIAKPHTTWLFVQYESLLQGTQNTGVLISSQPDQEGNKLQRQKILIFIYPIYNHNWRNISTIYTYNKNSIERNILTIIKHIRKQVGLRTYQHPCMIRVFLDMSDIASFYLPLTNYVCYYTATSVDRPALLLRRTELVLTLRIT